jgi:hypothetical protein
MKRRHFVPFLASYSAAFASAAPDSTLQRLPDPEILTGSYRIVGCLPDSEGCFEGSCRIRRTPNRTLVMQRLVSGEESAGTVPLERLVENVFTVVSSFSHKGTEYISNYQLQPRRKQPHPPQRHLPPTGMAAAENAGWNRFSTAQNETVRPHGTSLTRTAALR